MPPKEVRMKKLLTVIVALASFFGLVSTVFATCNYQMRVTKKTKTDAQVELQKQVRAELVNKGIVERELL